MPAEQFILVTGKNGQLGNELQAIAGNYPYYKFLFADRDSLDITDQQKVDAFFAQHSISHCINTAAYTAVDKAETEKELALQVNSGAVKNLAVACKKYSSKLIHISTDYVFDGTATTPYREDDPTNPINFYGQTKLLGEENALQTLPGCAVIRTSWVYSVFGKNFVKTMLQLMSQRSAISVVNDQFGSPTYARDLAEACMHIIEQDISVQHWQSGRYHFSNTGAISWYDFAQKIKELSHSSCIVSPVPTSAYPTPAKRPAYSVFDKTKIASTYQLEIKNWEESLKKCIAKLLKENKF